MKRVRVGTSHPDYPCPGFYLEASTVDEVIGRIPISSAEDEATADYIKATEDLVRKCEKGEIEERKRASLQRDLDESYRKRFGDYPYHSNRVLKAFYSIVDERFHEIVSRSAD